MADGTPLKPEWVEAGLKALALASHRQNRQAYHPQNFPRKEALLVLATLQQARPEWRAKEDGGRLLDYMEKQLNLLRRQEGGTDSNPLYRIALDPLADYLAALAFVEELEADRTPEAHLRKLRDWLEGLREEPDPQRLVRMGGFLAACRDCYKDWLNRLPENLEASLVNDWARVPDDIAFLAGIDPDEERRLEVKQLIRRHAEDLRWANPELRAKAIAKLTRYGKEFPGIPELALALLPLERTMAKTAYPAADRAAAAEALGHIGGPRAAEALLLRIRSGEESAVAVRRAAAEALGLLDASADNPEAHWDLLQEILADGGQHLHGETDPARIEAKLPLLQGASRGLQRLAARSRPFRLPVWGSGRGLKVPMLTLTTAAGAVTTRLVTVEVWQVPLPGGLPLEVVEIQGGTFPIGSPRGELGRDAYGYAPEAAGIEVEAQRLVTVPTFAMARFPITQAQWQTLAEANPSQHKGADLPVECVSWHDSQSWLKRLNRWLAEQGPAQGLAGEPPRLALPSESLWEVACRGGSASPFHFGDTLRAAQKFPQASPAGTATSPKASIP